MHRLTSLAAASFAITLVACQGDPGLVSDTAVPLPEAPALAQSANAHVSGKGTFSLAGSPVQFNVEASQEPHGNVHGTFHQFLDEGEGLTADFDAEVTCVTHDPVNHRAWIGGKVTANRSTDPDLIGGIHAVGQDVWFRVLDNGNRWHVPDRSTFLGFQGAAGFNTSADYCAGQPWPAENARTWPVTDGDIHINP